MKDTYNSECVQKCVEFPFFQKSPCACGFNEEIAICDAELCYNSTEMCQPLPDKCEHMQIANQGSECFCNPINKVCVDGQYCDLLADDCRSLNITNVTSCPEYPELSDQICNCDDKFACKPGYMCKEGECIERPDPCPKRPYTNTGWEDCWCDTAKARCTFGQMCTEEGCSEPPPDCPPAPLAPKESSCLCSWPALESTSVKVRRMLTGEVVGTWDGRRMAPLNTSQTPLQLLDGSDSMIMEGDKRYGFLKDGTIFKDNWLLSSSWVRLGNYPKGYTELFQPKGRVELFKDGKWGTLCGHHFWDNHMGATVICKALGYKRGIQFKDPGGSGHIFGHKANIKCKTGDEETIWQCAVPGGLDCSHDHDIGVQCFDPDPDIDENGPQLLQDALQIYGIGGTDLGDERLECQPGTYCDRDTKKCESVPSECPAMPSAATKSCLCPSAIAERCQDCRVDTESPKPDSVRLSSEIEVAAKCTDSDLTTSCTTEDSKEFPFLVLKYSEPITVKQVLVWHNREKYHRAQNLKVFVLPDDQSLTDHTLINVAEEYLLGNFTGPPEEGQDYILFGDKCAPGIEGSVVAIQRDTLGWGSACPECLVLDLAEVVVKVNVTDKSDLNCSSVSTVPPKEVTGSSPNPANGIWIGGETGSHPWLLLEFEQTIEVKEVVILPVDKLFVKDIKVFVGKYRPEFQSGKLFMNEPVCGVRPTLLLHMYAMIMTDFLK